MQKLFNNNLADEKLRKMLTVEFWSILQSNSFVCAGISAIDPTAGESDYSGL